MSKVKVGMIYANKSPTKYDSSRFIVLRECRVKNTYGDQYAGWYIVFAFRLEFSCPSIFHERCAIMKTLWMHESDILRDYVAIDLLTGDKQNDTKKL